MFDAVVEHVVDELGDDPGIQREPLDSFLLGYLLLEASAMALQPDSDAAESPDPVPGGLSAIRTPKDRDRS